jgi:Asp-tRNA(Asn)/Glu-tRNA(Gln) amidotransferase A subunit family amidase
MNLFPPADETIDGVGRALREGRLTCVGLLGLCLARIDDREANVRAWVVVDREGAAEQAATLDAELASGHDRGPLHGIPVGIKDIVDVRELPTAAGATLWARGNAKDDSEVVARLRAAGAVILGKTVTTAYAWVDPAATHNPWDLDRTPGGSSSGSAAAVASGMCLAAIGTQTGGSIIRPASYCGIAGFKPRFGENPGRGIVPLAEHLDHVGPLAHCVADLAHVQRVLAPSTDFDEVDDAPTRILVAAWMLQRAEDSMRRAFDRAIEALGRAGARVIGVADPLPFDEIAVDYRRIVAVEAAGIHAARMAEHPEDYPPRIRALVEEGLKVPGDEYRLALERQEGLRSAGSRLDGDLLAAPATMGAAPDRTTTGDPSMNAPFSFLGLPVVTFPVGLSAEGLPLGIQLVGIGPRAGSSAATLRASAWCERVVREGFASSFA